jgi:uncharacterized protein YjiS (DUF1127 family)
MEEVMSLAQSVTQFAGIAGKYSWAAVVAPLAMLGTGIVAYAGYLRDRRELQYLSEFSDAGLRDIGLSRGDLLAAREEWNPTARLTEIVADRKGHRPSARTLTA